MENVSCKLVCTGDNGIGKTSLLISYASNYFPDPTGYLPDAHNANEFVYCDGKQINLTLCDVHYSEDFTRLRALNYSGADVFLLGFSIDNRRSFEAILDTWYPEIRHHQSDVPIILVGYKVDLRDSIEWLNKFIYLSWIFQNCKRGNIILDFKSKPQNNIQSDLTDDITTLIMSFVCELILLDISKNPGISGYWMGLNKEKSNQGGTFVRGKQLGLIKYEEGVKLAERIDAVSYIETSALTQHGVKNLIDSALHLKLYGKVKPQKKPKTNRIQPQTKRVQPCVIQ